ncbi:MAG: glycosyltransferase [Parasporobacterium sp.]|nr:glycosyltransferase [Parasporobacterium sp.]
MDEITFIIKTLERPHCLVRLIRSILSYYSEAKILIGDDSEHSCREMVEKRFPGMGITVLELQRDCGISYGRNELVKMVKTPYFVLLDDDFEFDKGTDLENGLCMLKDFDYDIVGGYFRNYPVIRSMMGYLLYPVRLAYRGVQKRNYIGFIEEKGDKVKVRYYTKRFPERETVDIVHNFFIARTDVIRDRCLWDEPIKIHEHTPFFIKAKRQGLRVGFDGTMSVKHKSVKPRRYRQYRERNYIQAWMRLYGFHVFSYSTDDREEKTIILDE